MTPTKAEEMAAELEADGFSPKAHYGAAAELRRLSAVEAERDELKLAFAHAVRLVQDWKQSVYTTEAERDALLAARTSPVHGWTDADADAARLALELECILTDRDTPMPLTSRWWESAHEALALHRRRISDELREIECPPDPDAVDRALDADALRAALADAAQSLETIAKNAGKKLDSEGQENMLAHHDQVRGYANSRAGAARAAMKGTT